MEILRKVWKQSKLFRIFLIIALLWFTTRLVFQIVFQSYFETEWFSLSDMQSYTLASERLIDHDNIYRPEEMKTITAFQYAPSYALVYFPLTRLPISILSVGWMLVQILAYLFLWLRWNSLLGYLELNSAREILSKFLPVWLIFSTFWSDLAYANVYIIMALLATLLIEAVLKRNLGWSIICLGFILQIKPQWAFAIFIPLCQRDWKFLSKLIVGAGLMYLGCMWAAMLTVGSNYILSQYSLYFQFMSSLDSYFPWSKLPFLGYNHSVLQTIIHFTDLPFSAVTVGIAILIKVILLAPLVWVSWRFGQIHRLQAHALMLALGWYLGIFVMMDVIWEITLTLPVLAIIWSTLRATWEKWGMGILIGVYAALDIWRLVSYGLWRDTILWQGSGYLITDPALYIPVVLLALLAMYAVLLRNLLNSIAVS